MLLWRFSTNRSITGLGSIISGDVGDISIPNFLGSKRANLWCRFALIVSLSIVWNVLNTTTTCSFGASCIPPPFRTTNPSHLFARRTVHRWPASTSERTHATHQRNQLRIPGIWEATFVSIFILFTQNELLWVLWHFSAALSEFWLGTTLEPHLAKWTQSTHTHTHTHIHIHEATA